MTEQRLLLGTYVDDAGEHNEEFMAVYEEDPMEAYKKVIINFNETLRPHESERVVLSAKWNNSQIKIYCDFQKTNFMTQKDSIGYYDRVKCRTCGKVRRRRKIDSSDVEKIICKGRRT